MAFTSDEFRRDLDSIETQHQEWFSKYPPIRGHEVNSIHDHYYVYMSGSGYQLRFHADSNLPVEVRNQIKEVFTAVTDRIE
ncbi:hypothetical protein [Arcticibacter sp. MXS-1]|uniref:hypothetical protein n=1 Tax=Arcticibacter sp. MXS-1 TaxID=3341726 RepID=UPI0035A8F005